MRVFKITFLLSALYFSFGCAHYGPYQAGSGGYVEKKINYGGYALTFSTGINGNPFSKSDELVPLWERRATELCGGTDYNKDVRFKRLDPNGHESVLGMPAVVGVLYCNTKFVDTRMQLPEENFQYFINMDSDFFEEKNRSELFGMLIGRKYAQLSKDVADKYRDLKNNKISEKNFQNTLSEITPTSADLENYFNEWINAFPNEVWPIFSRAQYYYNLAWEKRSSDYANNLTDKQLEGFNRYRDLAKRDVDRVISIDPSFSLGYSLKISLCLGGKDEPGKRESIFQQAIANAPGSLSVYAAYLRSLEPRWYGSVDQMKDFVDKSAGGPLKSADSQMLRALYTTEQADEKMQNGQYGESLDLYDKAIQQGDWSSTFTQRGWVLINLGRYIDAINSFTVAAQLTPSNLRSYAGLIDGYLRTGEYLKAVKISLIMTSLNNQNPSYFRQQGDIFYSMRRYADALNRYNKSAALSDSSPLDIHLIKMAQYQISVRRASQQLDSIKEPIGSKL